MLNLLITGIVTGIFISFAIIAANKTGYIEKLIAMTDNKIIWNLLTCYFCMGFWLALLVVIPFVLVTHDIELIFVPIISAIVTRHLI